MKRRFLPVLTDSIVVALLLAALIYGAVSTARVPVLVRPISPKKKKVMGMMPIKGQTIMLEA